MADKRLTLRDLFAHPLHIPALGFGAGLSPIAPGTFGTLIAVPICSACAYFLGEYFVLAVVMGFFAGVSICGKTARNLDCHDHGGIVWDEIIGFAVTILWLPLTWTWMLAAFLLFRFFDIVKPWPIGWLDKRIHGGLGIMLDDVIAGAMACAILHASAQLL
ncbi:MAG: phosphatidylglycerophosphatase A [Pseudomonadota bacterium]